MTALAQWCFRRRRTVVALWLLAILVIGVGGSLVGTRYKGDFDLPKSDAQRAQALLKRDSPEQAAPPDTIVIHALHGKKVTDPDVIARVDPIFTAIRSLSKVEFVSTYYADGNGDHVNSDGTIAYSDVQIKIPDSGTPVADVKRVMDTAKQINDADLQVEFEGKEIQDTIQPTPGIDEGIGLVFAGIILFIAFGSLVTMSLPLITAVVSLGVSIFVIGLLSHISSIASFAPTLAGLMALGVGIDYALFIVNRHQHNLMNNMDIEESVIASVNTSGRAVLFAGVIVCAALVGLIALNIAFLTGLALAAAVAVLVTMLASVTFLPAMLGFTGIKALTRKQRVLQAAGELQEPDVRQSWWYRFTLRIQRHRYAWGAGALAIMLLVSVPLVSMRLGATDEGNDPSSATTRKAYDLLQKGFGVGHNGPLLLVTELHGPNDFNTFTNLADAISGTPGVQTMEGPTTTGNGRSAVLTVYPTSSPQSADTTTLLKRLRSNVIPSAEKQFGLRVYVGGETASFSDFGTVVSHKLPVFIAVVLGLSFILLMIVLRSVFVPLKAIAMNLLTTGATFGVVVAMFQWGWGGEQMGGGKGPIESYVPVILFAITFGLSMDYEVFLTSRIREEWLRTGDNAESVALGQAKTGRLITAAALIMVSIFLSFLLGDDRIIKLFGVGLATAILLDALVVRSVLVPAVMYAVGDRNWWLPTWLDDRIPHLDVEHNQAPIAKGKKAKARK